MYFSGFVFVYFLVFCELCFSTIQYSIDSFYRDSRLDKRTEQRSIVNYDEKVNIDSNLLFNLAMNFQYKIVNSTSYVSQEENSEFELNVDNFSISYAVEKNEWEVKSIITLGIQDASQFSYVSENIAASGVVWNLESSRLIGSSGLFQLPSQRKYYIAEASKEERGIQSSRMWSSSVNYELIKNQTYKTNVILNYDHFWQLDSNSSFNSGLRGNSTLGNELTSVFLYDYSIPSISMRLKTYIGKWDFIVNFDFGRNLGAPIENGQFYKISSGIVSDQSTLTLSYLQIARDSMVSIYTSEVLDRTNVEGFLLESLLCLKQDIWAGMKLGVFQNIDDIDDSNTQYSLNLFFNLQV